MRSRRNSNFVRVGANKGYNAASFLAASDRRVSARAWHAVRGAGGHPVRAACANRACGAAERTSAAAARRTCSS